MRSLIAFPPFGMLIAISGLLEVLVWRQQSYSAGFTILIVPAVVGLLILVWLQRRDPNPQEFEPKSHQLNGAGIPRLFWFYLTGVAFLAIGYAVFR